MERYDMPNSAFPLNKIDRKEACEQIILTKKEQRLLSKIRRNKKNEILGRGRSN